ncbi:MAG: hypothetical protein HUK26_08925 [Duodenibacillus sp.]|nr:hypothetical protein [Duodenibacillus sp.]
MLDPGPTEVLIDPEIPAGIRRDMLWIAESMQGPLTPMPGTGRAAAAWGMFSVWALLFGPLPWFLRRLWKKGLVVLAIAAAGEALEWLAVQPLIDGQGPGAALGWALRAAGWGVTVWLAFLFKWDCWRRYVAKEDFWW